MLGLQRLEEHVAAQRRRDAGRRVRAPEVADVGRASTLDIGRPGDPEPARAPLTQAGSSACATEAPIPISPASASASIRTVSVAVGPARSSSRWTLPAMKQSIRPAAIPTDMRSVTALPPTAMRPTRSSVRCISQAARTARASCSWPSKRSSSASRPT